jgi:5-methylcytosine-specific restriction endonuclease McrA
LACARGLCRRCYTRWWVAQDRENRGVKAWRRRNPDKVQAYNESRRYEQSPKNCAVCNKEFNGTAGRVYCSVSCRNRRHYADIGRTIDRTCIGCGEAFKVMPRETRRGWGKYCSIACYNQSRAAQRAKREEERGLGLDGWALNAPLTRYRIWMKQEQRRKHREYMAEYTLRKYHKDPATKARMIANAQRSMAKRRGAKPPFNHVGLPEIAMRDQWRCHICGGKVTRRTWSLDHLVPASKGGPHTAENVALAHGRCNSSRQAGRFETSRSLIARAAFA